MGKKKEFPAFLVMLCCVVSLHHSLLVVSQVIGELKSVCRNN